MKEDNASVIARIGPDLCVSPHILPVLMELFAGEKRRVLSQQEQLITHLATCHYCRTAVIALLSLMQEYDRRKKYSEEVAHDLLERFADISREIEAREAAEYERLGVYAEAIVAEGQDKADLRFPDIAAHLKICPDCRSSIEATVCAITESEETS